MSSGQAPSLLALRLRVSDAGRGVHHPPPVVSSTRHQASSPVSWHHLLLRNWHPPPGQAPPPTRHQYPAPATRPAPPPTAPHIPYLTTRPAPPPTAPSIPYLTTRPAPAGAPPRPPSRICSTATGRAAHLLRGDGKLRRDLHTESHPQLHTESHFHSVSCLFINRCCESPRRESPTWFRMDTATDSPLLPPPPCR